MLEGGALKSLKPEIPFLSLSLESLGAKLPSKKDMQLGGNFVVFYNVPHHTEFFLRLVGADHGTVHALITWLSCTDHVTAHALMTWLFGH